MGDFPIPRKLWHIWVGHRPPPLEWMRTWTEVNPRWSYRIFDNDALAGSTFRTAHLIERYMNLRQYAGVADLVRYELLFAEGGFIAAADSVCLRPIDELFTRSTAYTVYENEFVRGKLVSPILACEPGNPFVGKLIDRLAAMDPVDLQEPWVSTGNLFVAKMIEEFDPDVVVFPSHVFNPSHYTGVIYEGEEKIYSCQFFGSTRNLYRELHRSGEAKGQSILEKIFTHRRRAIERGKRKQDLEEFRRHVAERRASLLSDYLARISGASSGENS